MPQKRKNAPSAPPPWWLAPLEEWMREVVFALTSNGRFDDAGTLRLLMRIRGGAIAKLMRDFTRRDAPAPLPSADSWRAPFKRPPLDRVLPLLPALRVERERRAILDDLSVDKRRQIYAAGGVIWVAFYAHRHKTRLERGGPRDLNHPGDVVGIERVRIRDVQKAHALAVGGKTLAAMQEFYGKPRLRLTRSVVKVFTGEEVPVEKLRELGKRLAAADQNYFR
jgi:hypothetical protein